MPKFIDTHPMGKLTAEQLKKLQTAEKDEFGVTHHDILYNQQEDRVYCVLDAPSKEAVEKHHRHAGIECNWVHQIESTRSAATH
ncbi:MAG TPA: nickel-binding protein [Thermoplasmata archaeon]|nr:nickel-binding protein [Thermoplasmata archaeon]